jgi:hypothetical protein
MCVEELLSLSLSLSLSLLLDFCRDNYFFVGYLLGRYTEQCCPEYLKGNNVVVVVVVVVVVHICGS